MTAFSCNKLRLYCSMELKFVKKTKLTVKKNSLSRLLGNRSHLNLTKF